MKYARLAHFKSAVAAAEKIVESFDYKAAFVAAEKELSKIDNKIVIAKNVAENRQNEIIAGLFYHDDVWDAIYLACKNKGFRLMGGEIFKN